MLPFVSATTHSQLSFPVFNVFFSRALGERLRATHPTVIVNSVNPGLAATALTRDAKPSDMPIFMRIMHATIAVTAEVGSRELVWAALAGSERAGSLQGAYIDRCEVREPSDFVLSEKGRIAQDRTFVRGPFLTSDFISNICPSARNRSSCPED